MPSRPSEQSLAGAIIHVNSLSHRYKESGLILDRLSFKIQTGEFVSILGPSGCGKSTLLRMLAGLEVPSIGTIQFEVPSSSTQIAQKSPELQSLALVRGVVFQEPRLLPWRTALENVRLPLEFQKFNKTDLNDAAFSALENVGLKDFVKHYPSELSGGMKMRVSVARALVTHPNLLLLDEPFAALDESTRHTLQNDLRAVWERKKTTIVFVTHSISEAVYLSNRAIIFPQRPARTSIDEEIQLSVGRPPEVRLAHQFTSEIKRISDFLKTVKNLSDLS